MPAAKKQKTDGASDALHATSINTIRMFSADMVEAAKSGHPGAPMGLAPLAHKLFSSVMDFSPSTPEWWNRDRFVLSNGHGCALQYCMLHLSGYAVSLDDCKNFRQLGSITPGHPENFMTPGVEVCTGPLGQGLSNAVGMAIAERHLAATFNTQNHKIINNTTYCICGDGCLQEGVTSEACSLAGHLGLGKLILFWDDNEITIDGSTSLSFTEDVRARFLAYGWQVLSVDDVNDLSALDKAVKAAQAEDGKPSIIAVKTVIGAGSSKAGTAKAHGAPLGADDMKKTKEFYGMDPAKTFVIPPEVKEYYKEVAIKQEMKKSQWDTLWVEYAKAEPDKAAELKRRFEFGLPDGFVGSLPSFVAGTDKDVATRKSSQGVLNCIASICPELVGGSADLTPSNLTCFDGAVDFQKATPEGRYLRFGVREHAMAAICNGMFAYGGCRPYCASFLNFAGYALGAIRVSALSKFGVLYIMTHDSIGLGEDGPTHQPVEMLESLRSMPNVNVMRPCDANEVSAAYKVGMECAETPSVICLSRQTLPNMPGSGIDKCLKGAYVIHQEGRDEDVGLVLVASGSEVGLCIDAAKALGQKGVKTRVVSMFCMDIFNTHTAEYKKGVFLNGIVPCVSVEASSPHGWNKWSHAQVAMNRFGASAPAAKLFEKFGFSVGNVCEVAEKVVGHYKGRHCPNLFDVVE